jgi:hypothetical protein
MSREKRNPEVSERGADVRGVVTKSMLAPADFPTPTPSTRSVPGVMCMKATTPVICSNINDLALSLS